jgi:hypothetical protein
VKVSFLLSVEVCTMFQPFLAAPRVNAPLRVQRSAVFLAFGLATTATALTRCNLGAAECGAGIDSSLSFSGTIALPDDAIYSLVITACVDSDCYTTLEFDGGSGATQAADAATPTVSYFNGSTGYTSWTLTQVRSGLYDLEGGVSSDNSPTGFATSGTASVTIKSGGTTLYAKTVDNVPCTMGPVGCQNSPSETCTVRLP